MHGGVKLNLLRELLHRLLEFQLLEVELLHRYDFNRGVAPLAEGGPVLDLLHLHRQPHLLQILNNLGAPVLYGHPGILPRNPHEFPINVYGHNLRQLELPEQLDVIVISIAADHHDPAPELRVDALVGPYGDLPVVEGHQRCLAR